MNEADMIQYHEWLLRRSWKGYLYRRYYLYPRLWRYVRGKTLDVGCGIGDFIGLTKNSIGADINKYNVQYCLNKNIDAVLFSNNKLPFDENSFDCVIFDNVIEHIYDSNDILNDAARVLSKGGLMVIGVPVFKHFFHDADHKIYHSKDSMMNALLVPRMEYESDFNTPSNSILKLIFKHTCRWYVYKKT